MNEAKIFEDVKYILKNGSEKHKNAFDLHVKAVVHCINNDKSFDKRIDKLEKDIDAMTRDTEFQKVNLQKQGQPGVEGLKLVKGGKTEKG